MVHGDNNMLIDIGQPRHDLAARYMQDTRGYMTGISM